MEKEKNIYLGGFVFFFSFMLIIGRHFDARWAGGEGFEEASSVITIVDEKEIPDVDVCAAVDVSRENILTCSKERKQVRFGASTIWMDENTELVVANRSVGAEALTFYTGRIVVHGPLTLHVRERIFVVSGVATLVHYGWMNRCDVFAIEGDIVESSTVIASGSALRFDTLAPYDASETIDAEYAKGGAIPFYAWVEKHSH
jgi:hypothetical protein